MHYFTEMEVRERGWGKLSGVNRILICEKEMEVRRVEAGKKKKALKMAV
jgi:hypothetical protein